MIENYLNHDNDGNSGNGVTEWKSYSITSFQINNSDACLVIWDHKIWFGFLIGTKSGFLVGHQEDLSNWIFNGCDNMFLWYLLAGRIMGPPGHLARWPPDKATWWPTDHLTRWPTDMLTNWPADKVTKWPSDQVAMCTCDACWQALVSD